MSNCRLVSNAEVIPEPSNILSRSGLAWGKLKGPFKSQKPSRLQGWRPGTDRRFRKIKSFGEDNFLRFPGFRCLQVPVFGAGRNDYNVSEVKDRRDRSNELYEQVAALG
jgi:hypothetical protein